MQSAFRMILYRGRRLVAILACTSFLVAAGAAQEERPQITPGERKVPRKKDAGPRALGVLQLAENGKATLLPIFILIDGKYYDATDYKADPIPMALDSGIVYEGTRTGNSLGLFTVSSALHSKAANSASPWIGTGTWLPTGTEPANKAHKAETVPVGIETSDGPPRLTRNSANESKDAPASSPSNAGSPPSTGTTPPSSSPISPPSAPSSAPSSAPPSSSGTPSSTPPSSTAPASPSGGSGSAPSPTPPTSEPAKPSGSKPSESKPSPPSDDSGADASHRPRLRRGVPNQPLPEECTPTLSTGSRMKKATAASR